MYFFALPRVVLAGFSSSTVESAMPAEDPYDKDDPDPNFLLTVHGYIMDMRRVKGDDGDKDQVDHLSKSKHPS